MSSFWKSLQSVFTGNRRRTVRRFKSSTVVEPQQLEQRCLLAAAQPRLSISDATISENDAATLRAEVTVTIDQPLTVQTAFVLSTRSRTAIAGIDFPSRAMSLVIPAGERSVTASFEIRDDLRHEANEQFDVVLSAGRRISIAKAVGIVTILDDDAAPIVTLGNSAIAEGVTAMIPIRLSAVSGLPTRITLQTRDGSANVGTDFTGVSTTITIPAGQTTANLFIATRPDTTYEINEQFEVAITSAVNATAGPDAGRVTILNNDVAPIVSLIGSRIVEGTSTNTSNVLQAKLNAVSGVPVTLTVTATSRTALSGIDFDLPTTTIEIPAGQLSVPIPVSIFGDVTDEPDKTFEVTLSNVVEATLGAASSLVTIADDDGTVLPLFAASDMQYLGAFQVPTGSVGSASFEFGGNGLAWNAANQSLFIGSNVQLGLHVAEIGVPTLGNSTIAGLLPTASVLQPFVDLGSLLTTDAAGEAQSPLLSYRNLNLGGLLVTNGGLTGGMFMGYNGAEPSESTHTHFRTKHLNLASLTAADFEGLKTLRRRGSDPGGRLMGGYMAEVPAQWRQWIGANFVTGAAGLNRIQSSSSGPALFGFDANSPEGSLTEGLVYYPHEKPLQWMDGTPRRPAPPQPLFNGTSKVEGVMFVPGTRSVVFIGSNGLSQIGYGTGAELRDKARVYQGYHALNGVYKYQLWAYNIDDFVAVRNGVKKPWELRPTTVHNFSLPTPQSAHYLGGTAFDPATGRLFVSQKDAGAGFTPVIHVYQMGRPS